MNSLILISLMIAMPVAWGFMNNWLQHFQYRTGISWWIFAVAGRGIGCHPVDRQSPGYQSNHDEPYKVAENGIDPFPDIVRAFS
jgi:hypothetical protein